MNRTLLSLFLAAATLVGAPRSTFADVVSPPPTTCPDGSDPATCHGGPHCEPHLCATSADCTDGGSCVEVPFCVKTISCGGLLPPDADPSQYDKQAVESACAGSCDGGPCTSLKVCLPASTSTSESSSSSSGGVTESSGCACDVAGGPAGVGVACVALAAALGLALGRRRRQRAG